MLGLDQYSRNTRYDFPGLIEELLRRLEDRPLYVQFGGFGVKDHPEFRSRGKNLYERSFGIYSGYVTLIGWPMGGGAGGSHQPDPWLAEFRTAAENYGFKHKYHNEPGDCDPDAYVVIGEVVNVAPDACVAVERSARCRLSDEPVGVSVRPADISIVEYIETTLPEGSKVYKLG
jgi:hypothetical protein